MNTMLERIRQLFSGTASSEEIAVKLKQARDRAPVPVFWLLGKTQSGKSTIVKYLTGADDAEIGKGFQPCTRFSREYDFPTPDAPLLKFLDTRGLDEPGYDPKEDLEQFDSKAHVILLTVKATDHALESVVNHLHTIRDSNSDRPVVLALTCLHEFYPQQQHPPYPFAEFKNPGELAMAGDTPESVVKSIREHEKRFDGLYDYIVPFDITPADEGYDVSDYGGAHLKEVLLDALPSAYRQTLIALDAATNELQDLYAKEALPHILGYATMAASAGAIPIPFVDLAFIPAIQTRMIYHLAKFYGQPMTADRFVEVAGTLGLGLVVRQAGRELSKFIPFVGSVASAALAGASTLALGKAFCYYYSAVHKGQVPQAANLRQYYKNQLAQAETIWKKKMSETSASPQAGS